MSSGFVPPTGSAVRSATGNLQRAQMISIYLLHQRHEASHFLVGHSYTRSRPSVRVKPMIRHFVDPEKIPFALTVSPNIYDVLAVVLPQRWKEFGQEPMESGDLVPPIGHESRFWDARKRRIDALNIDGTRKGGVTFYTIERNAMERVASREDQNEDNGYNAGPHPTALVSPSASRQVSRRPKADVHPPSASMSNRFKCLPSMGPPRCGPSSRGCTGPRHSPD